MGEVTPGLSEPGPPSLEAPNTIDEPPPPELAPEVLDEPAAEAVDEIDQGNMETSNRTIEGDDKAALGPERRTSH